MNDAQIKWITTVSSSIPSTVVASLQKVWSTIPEKYHKHILTPEKFLYASCAMFVVPMDVYHEARKNFWTYLLTHGEFIFADKTSVLTKEHVALTAQAGGNLQFLLLLQMFFMTIFVLFDREKYGGLMEAFGNVYANIQQDPELAFVKIARKLVGENPITKTIFTTVLGTYDNNCDIVLTTLNILVYIMFAKDIAATLYNNPTISISQVMAHDDVATGFGNTVNWLFKDVYDMRMVKPTVVEIVKSGFTMASPAMSRALSLYLEANSPTFGSIIKPIFQHAPTIFEYIFYSRAYKETITLPAASFLRSIGFTSCQKYFQAAGRRRKTRKGKGRRRTQKRRV